MLILKKTRVVLVVSVYLHIFIVAAQACIYSVRDLGFFDLRPAPYHLYYYVPGNTSIATLDTFKRVSQATFMDSNIIAEIIAVHRGANPSAMEYFNFWKIESLPAAILVSPDERSLVVPTQKQLRPTKEMLRVFLETIVSSPKRNEILRHIIRSYCLVLLVEGNNRAENERALAAINEARNKIIEIMGQLPKHIDYPPRIMKISLESAANEQVLLWSLGMNTERTADQPRAAVLYGRARMIGSYLEGPQITAAKMFNIFSAIGLSCECGLDRQWIMGTLIPTRWSEKMRSEMVKYLGFDVENPMVKMEISGILSAGALTSGNGDAGNSSGDKVLAEYSEGALKLQDMRLGARVSPAQFRELGSAAAKNNGLSLKLILILSALVIAIILSGSALILIRTKRVKS